MLIGAVVFDYHYQSLRHESHDLEVMSLALSNLQQSTIDCADSGTALRLLTALLATQSTPHILTGTERLSHRPIQPLVEALRQLGADLSDSWPLRICGPLHGSRTTIDASQSSQFVTALMLIAPTLPEGLTIELTGELTSAPYIALTEKVMLDCGVTCRREGNAIVIPHQSYHLPHREIEADWSNAAFFYEMVALRPSLQLQLNRLFEHSWQGDAIAQQWFEPLGVETLFNAQGARLQSKTPTTDELSYDFTNHPDLFMPLAATACGMQRSFCFSGLKNLQHKESTRLTSMGTALRLLGFNVEVDEIDGTMSFDGQWEKPQQEVAVDGCNDHRIVMALTPLKGLVRLNIKGEEAVAKSFPNFLEQYQKTL